MTREWIRAIHRAYPISPVSDPLSLTPLISPLLGKAWRFDGAIESPKSVLTLYAGSLAPYLTYQFMLIMTDRRNSSPPGIGYLLVNVESTQPQMIAIA